MKFPFALSILTRSIFIFIFAIFFLARSASCTKRFDGYAVYRVQTSTVEQVELLRNLEHSYPDDVSIWSTVNIRNPAVDIMISPGIESTILDTFKTNDLSYKVYINDVQNLIDNENPVADRLPRADDYGTMNWTSYHRLDAIYNWLDELAETYPDLVEVVVIGESFEGRLIKGIKITFNEENKGVFVEGGMHAREWITPATVTYLINEILTTTDPEFKLLAQSHNWFIFPNTNPDGYEYSHTDNRMWRKTRQVYDAECTCSDCTGADPNRNWDYYWLANGGASNSSCDTTYAGPEPFSEPEIKALAEYINAVKNEFYIYLSIHSYSQLILLPYGYTYDHLDNYEDAKYIGDKAAEALAVRYGTNYTVGATAETIYVATGTSTDYVKGVHKTAIVYCYELRDTGSYGFLLPTDQIIPNSLEFLDSLVALLGEARKLGYPEAPVDLI